MEQVQVLHSRGAMHSWALCCKNNLSLRPSPAAAKGFLG